MTKILFEIWKKLEKWWNKFRVFLLVFYETGVAWSDTKASVTAKILGIEEVEKIEEASEESTKEPIDFTEVDKVELENQIESEQERKERFEPVYQEKPVDEVLQTGESRLLGGEMRLAAKWVIEEEEREQAKIDKSF